jgi:adenosylhomocysteinase
MLTWPDYPGPDVLVDDGGDATMLILKGAEAEDAYEKDKTLPDATKYKTDDEQALFALIAKNVQVKPT